MTLASASGYSLEQILDSVGTLSTVLSEFTLLFQKSIADANAAMGTAAPQPTRALMQMPVLSLGGAGVVAPALPASVSWVTEVDALVLVKQCVDGRMAFFTNRAFEAYVVSRQALQATWATRARPSTELFLHPEDAEQVCSLVGQLWKGLTTSSIARPHVPGEIPQPGALLEEKTCMRDLPTPIRVWVTFPYRGYMHCNCRLQLVISRTAEGQSSHVVFCFAADARLSEQQPQPVPHNWSGSVQPHPDLHSAALPSVPSSTPAVHFSAPGPTNVVPPGHLVRAAQREITQPDGPPPPMPALPAAEPPPPDSTALFVENDDFWETVTLLTSDNVDEFGIPLQP